MQIYSVSKYSLNVSCLPELTVLYTRNTEISNHALRRKKEKKSHKNALDLTIENKVTVWGTEMIM